jgi:hypothetical protein
MLFVKMFSEFDVLLALWLLIEILVPMARGRARFPMTKWALRKLRLLPPLPTPGEDRVATANDRLSEAKDRLKAAEAEVEAAKLEQQARNLEAEANKTPRS